MSSSSHSRRCPLPSSLQQLRPPRMSFAWSGAASGPSSTRASRWNVSVGLGFRVYFSTVSALLLCRSLISLTAMTCMYLLAYRPCWAAAGWRWLWLQASQWSSCGVHALPCWWPRWAASSAPFCCSARFVRTASRSVAACLLASSLPSGRPAGWPPPQQHPCLVSVVGVQEAAEHDRLKSETYQRLNLGLLFWGLGTAAALWLAPQPPRRLALG